ncbi:cytochrome P450 monooxygenase pc-bph [Guyanagaster necrorhizus]|uniref:Cytochrome P450 monooxygenase pc-bph n=1 Tax=Guyanagaster necrorhizus TaxID=856835 RepID=A0A9P8ASP8_9AGAR|nr:cytochrome P450 monooxygenase pc-bph [Guyanagaster necrorhizus MCA 3950]KAG7445087.1 cytochrome P450 monooxygenase pc-bph [Guyanagaster necrorhizus MCA 3950]
MFHLSLKLLHTDLLTSITTVIVLALLVHLVPYLIDSHRLRSYPGPLVAKFSDVWLAYVSYQGHRSVVIHDLHKKYGPFVRLAPNHISVALSDAQPLVYGHGNGALKSSFYDVFVTTSRSLFTVRDRQTHSRKRKIISHSFSQKNVLEFQPYVRRYVGQLLGQWEKLYDNALKGMSGKEGEGWEGRDGRLWLDCLPWANYLVFDIIGDLAFGNPFGMIMAAKDSAPMAQDPHAVMDSYGQAGVEHASKEIEVIKILGGSSQTFLATMGALPNWWRSLIALNPLFWEGGQDFRAVIALAIMAVSKRLETSTERNDLLSKLQAGKDEDGNPMSREELTAEALTLLVAGSDTTSNTTCAIIYYIARAPSVQEKLCEEIDKHLGSYVATAEQVKNLPYLQAVINEGLRLYSTIAMGLPRVVPEGGLTMLGNHFPEGTIISVPSYTLHRDPSVFGDDVEEFRPERWFECDSALVSKAFSPFSVGPRACVGRNLANLELQIIIASIFKSFNVTLEIPDQVLQIHEGILRKPIGCRVGLKRREVL